MFADDLLVFAKATVKNAAALVDVLERTDLLIQVNGSKSHVSFSSSVQNCGEILEVLKALINPLF